MLRILVLPAVLAAALLILVASASYGRPAHAEAPPYATPTRLPGITPTAASAGLLNSPLNVGPTLAPPGSGAPPPSTCDLRLATYAGGQTATFFDLVITFPSGHGDFLVQMVPVDPAPNQVRICYQAGRAVLVLNGQTGAEISRQITDSAAGAVLDQVKAGVIVKPAAGPTPMPSAVAPVRSGPPAGPTSTPVPSVCQLGGPEYRQAGNQTIVLGSFVMDLPEGDYLVATITRANVSSVQVCFAGDGSVLLLNPANGAEMSRVARGPEGAAAFDRVVASVRPPGTAGGCLADCGAIVVPPASGLPPGGIKPPNTGDAGLALGRALRP